MINGCKILDYLYKIDLFALKVRFRCFAYLRFLFTIDWSRIGDLKESNIQNILNFKLLLNYSF